MKYILVPASLIAIVFLFLMQRGVFSPHRDGGDVVIKIAREMREVASCCQTASSEEMKTKRLQFLKNNKSATIDDLMKAIETKVDGKDVIAYLDSFNSDVCKEYAQSIKTDYERGNRAIKNNFGDTSIETVMYWRLL
jgi:hypothetical protein